MKGKNQIETYQYECLNCKSIVPQATDNMTREQRRTCPNCKKQEGFNLIVVKE